MKKYQISSTVIATSLASATKDMVTAVEVTPKQAEIDELALEIELAKKKKELVDAQAALEVDTPSQ